MKKSFQAGSLAVKSQTRIQNCIYRISLVNDKDTITCIVCGNSKTIPFELGLYVPVTKDFESGNRKPSKGNKRKQKFIQEFESRHLESCGN